MTHCCVAEYDSPSHVYKASSSSPVELRELSLSCDSHYLCPLSVSPICVYLCPHLCYPHLCFPPLIHLLSPLFDNMHIGDLANIMYAFHGNKCLVRNI